jgi:AraC family transcriptional regulator, regulatory protein of adaptative response / methylated-DNA-[protein]-cysteine methyltransferase
MAHVISYTIGDTFFGPLLVAATARGVCAVRWGESGDDLAAELSRDHPDAQLARDDERLRRLIAPLVGDGASRDRDANLPLDVPATAFQRRVWETVRRIPAGETRTYGAVAADAGHPGAARAVARACAANPAALVIPCHRVVRGDGSMGGYRWGAHRKRQLLELEASTRAVVAV